MRLRVLVRLVESLLKMRDHGADIYCRTDSEK